MALRLASDCQELIQYLSQRRAPSGGSLHFTVVATCLSHVPVEEMDAGDSPVPSVVCVFAQILDPFLFSTFRWMSNVLPRSLAIP